MNETQPGNESSRQEWIDALCESFERQWKAGDRPALKEFLQGGVPEQYRADAVRELVALDVELRREAGEDPGLSGYLEKFPSDEEVVREGFALGEAQQSGSHTQPSQSRDVPDHIGSYRVESWLGEGAFGEVFKAHDPQENRIVALKVLLPHRASNADDLQRFVSEAERTLEFQHPGIVAVYGVKHDFRRPYIVQEFIEGSDLRHYARQTQLSHDQIVGMLVGIAEALAYIHAKNLYHRDLKPANVLIDWEGRPHLADFGLAMDVGHRWQHRGELAGSLAYMSREQIRGEPHLVTGSSDIWSLGVIMYELLTGELPFPGEPTRDPIRKAESIRAEIEGRGARGLREIAPETPRELQRICLQCLSKETAGRYPSASDLLDDLRQWQSAPLTIQPPLPPDAVAQVRFQSLRSFTEEDADFFLELLPGNRDRDGLPDSISFWKHRIERSDPDETFRLGVLYGISGSGKSSLLRAGLIPQLQRHAKHVTCVHVTASTDDTEVDLLKRLRRTFPGLPGEAAQDLSLPQAMHLLRETDLLRPNQKLLIILDQFEQWLHAHGGEADPQLLAALRQCDGGRVQALVAVRDGFMISLTRFLHGMDVRYKEGENAAVADLFTKPHARHVLSLFGQAMQKLPLTEQQRQFLDVAVDGLADDKGRIVCVRLALFAAMTEPWPWTPASINDLGGFDEIGVRFLRQTLEGGTDLEKRYEEVSQRVLVELLPSLGLTIKGNRRSRQALLDASEFPGSPAEFSEVLGFLEQHRLITPVERELGGEDEDDRARARKQGGDYQLTHDFLVPAVREYLAIKQTETRRGRAELRLAERASLWKAKPEDRHLPAWWEYCNIWLFTHRAKWTEAQQNMMRAARNFHGRRAVLGLLLLFAVGMAMSMWVDNVKKGQIAEKIETLRSSRGSAVQALIEDLRSFRLQTALSQLHTAFDEATQDFEKLPLAFAIAELDNDAFDELASGSPSLVDFLLKQIPEALPDDVDNFALALDKPQSDARRKIQAAAEECTKREDWTVKARLAALALYLGDTSIAVEMLRSNPDVSGEPFDPIQRTRFIAEFPSWSGQVEKLADVLADTESPHLRSGISLALGRIRRPSSRAKAGWKDVLTNWYQDKPDSGTHSASGWILKTWEQSLPVTVTERPVEGRMWWDTECGVTMFEIPDGQVTSDKNGLLRFRHQFWISKHEISIALFRRFMAEAAPEKRPDDWQGAYDFDAATDDQHPVQQVSYEDAAFFCNWLSEQCDLEPYYKITRLEARMKVRNRVVQKYRVEPIPNADGFRLPTADEWEYACRATTTTAWSCGDVEEWLGAYAVYNARRPHTVGSKICNSWGLFDMHGNVWEWCDTKEGPGRVCCGGGWYYSAGLCQSSSRNASLPTYRGSDRGFRVARGPLQPQVGTEPHPSADFAPASERVSGSVWSCLSDRLAGRLVGSNVVPGVRRTSNCCTS